MAAALVSSALVGAIMLATGFLGGGSSAAAQPAGPDRADPPDGRHLYLRDCAWCHSPSGHGTDRAVSLEEGGPAGVYYMLSSGRMPIAHPDARIHRSEPRYTDAEIDALVEYVASLVEGPELPAVDISSADLPAGGEIFRRECAACHSATGIGGALAFEGYAPSLLHSTPTETAAAIVAGPGSMPTFRGQLSDEEVSDIVAYVQYLHDPPTTGVPVPGGRVGEGLLGWLAGVGALVFAARWIGTRQ